MTTKFTPGPWRQTLPDDTAIVGADGWPVCETGVHQDYDEHFERMEADARLIAAAPELFMALQWAMQFVPYPHAVGSQDYAEGFTAKRTAALSALAKATGEHA